MFPRYRLRWLLLATLLLLPAGCSSAPESGKAPGAVPGSDAAAAPSPGDQATGGTSPSTEPGSQPAEPAAPPIPVPSDGVRPTVVDPGGLVVVTPTRDGLSAVGAAKCKVCHKVQFDSWSTSSHAERNPPLDCEGCHGPGSEYKTLAVMKDPERAKAAGLVIPGTEFCVRCHEDASDDMLPQAHLHKAGGA